MVFRDSLGVQCADHDVGVEEGPDAFDVRDLDFIPTKFVVQAKFSALKNEL